MKTLFLFCSLSFSVSLIGQNPYQEALTAKNYDEIIRIAQEQLKSSSTDSMAYYMIGMAYNKLEDYTKANKNLHSAKEFGLNSGPVKFNLALSYAGLGKVRMAVPILEEMVSMGIPIYPRLNDKGFASLQEDKEFQDAKQKAYALSFPCMGDVRYQKFDFWVGEWDVIVNGKKTADSKISHSNGNCGIVEDYQTLGTYSGTSLSYYDTADSLWKQNWVAVGGVSHYVENSDPYEADMEMINIVNAKNGTTTITKMSYIYDESNDTVSQILQQSTDNGSTWISVFSGLYTRKK